MFEVKKKVSIDIAITQEGLEKLIIGEIKRQDSAIVVSAIRFIQRRSPPTLEVEVDAHMAGQSSEPKPKEEAFKLKAEPKTPIELPVKTEEKVELKSEEAKPVKRTIKSLFDE